MATETEMDIELDEEKEEDPDLFCQAEDDISFLEFKKISDLPMSAEDYYHSAACYMKLDKYEKGLEDAKKHVEMDPKSIKGYVQLINIAIALADFQEAETALEALSVIDPANTLLKGALEKIGDIRNFVHLFLEGFAEKNSSKVLEGICKLSEICTHATFYKAIKGEYLALSGKYKEATVIAQSIIGEMYIEAKYIFAICLYHTDLKEALKCLAEILPLSSCPIRAVDLYRKVDIMILKKSQGKKALETEEYKKAHEIYVEVMAIDPDHSEMKVEMYCNMAQASYKMDLIKRSIEECTKALEIDPSCLKALARRGKCYMEVNDYEKAVNDFSKACEIDSGLEYRTLLDEALLKKSCIYANEEIQDVGADFFNQTMDLKVSN